MNKKYFSFLIAIFISLLLSFNSFAMGENYYMKDNFFNEYKREEFMKKYLDKINSNKKGILTYRIYSF